MKPIRIVHAIADGTPGGGTTFVLALTEALVREPGVEVHVITQRASYLAERAASIGAKVREADFFRSRLDPRAPMALRRILQEIRPDVLHAHGGRAAFFLSFVRRVPACSYVYTVHGYHFRHKPLPSRLLGALAERFVSSRFTTTVFVSETDRAIARAWHLLSRRAQPQVVRNAIDPTQIPRAEQTDERLIAFAGRLSYQKDPQLFVEIAGVLAPAGYRCVMLGSGELEPEVRALIANRGLQGVVELRVGLSRDQALEILRHAEACVLTSRWEGLPLVALEAMACGVPVVAPALPSFGEVIEHAVSGLLVPERTPQAFASAVRRLSGEPGLRASIVSTARRQIDTDFSYARFIAQYRSLYGLPLSGPRP